jgi:predicted transcriptional regulator
MSDIEVVQNKSLIDKIKDVEQVGLLHVKGYRNSEIAALMGLKVNEVKEYVEEYKVILNKTVAEDPYFLEKVQFNTIKALQEFDQLSKEAWETITIATDNGMVAARIQAIKLAGEIAQRKAQLHKLLGGNQADGEYIARMQKAENVNQILSKILKDVIAKHPKIAEEVRRELEIAFEIMSGGKVDFSESDDVDEKHLQFENPNSNPSEFEN